MLHVQVIHLTVTLSGFDGLRAGVKACAIFRIGNLRNSLFVKCVCKVKFIKSKQTVEGEFLPLDQKENGYQIVRFLFHLSDFCPISDNFRQENLMIICVHPAKDMDVGSATGADKLFLVTPMILKHEINEKSPFWNFSASDLMNEQFEIIVLLEGTVESTGQSSQARSSYLNTEILWGHRKSVEAHLGSYGVIWGQGCTDKRVGV